MRPTTRIVAVNLRRRKASAVIGAPVEVALANEPAHLGLSLFELTHATCKFPRGSGSFTFCGQPVEAGRPYCGFHSRLCYAPKDRNLDRKLERPVSNAQRRAA
jgi:hypothetical protein